MGCLICNDRDPHVKAVPVNLFANTSCSGASSAGLFSGMKSISKELSALFAVRNVLGVSSEYCEYLICSRGNPSSWGLHFCSICQRVLQEAHFVSERIRSLVQEFEGIKKKLTRSALNSFEVERRLVGKNVKGVDKSKTSVSDLLRTWFHGANAQPGESLSCELDLNLVSEDVVKEEVSLTSFEIEESTAESEINEGLNLPGEEEPGSSTDRIYTENPADRSEDKYVLVEGMVQCPRNCGRTFESIVAAKIHVGRYHERSSIPIECKLCRKRFPRVGKLRIHMRNNHSEEHVVPCPMKCGRLFKTLELSNVHFLKHHRGSKNPFKCNHCNRGFCRPSRLRIHKQTKHSEVMPTPVRRNFSLPKHRIPIEKLKTGKSQSRDAAISEISKEPVNENTGIEDPLRITENLVDGSASNPNDDSEWIGPEIQDEALNKAVIKPPISSEAKKHVCKLCGKGFPRPYKLRVHIRNKHNEELVVPCPLKCGQLFKTLELSNVHFLKHHKGSKNPFICNHCHRGFCRPSRLRVHKQLKHPEANPTQKNNMLLKHRKIEIPKSILTKSIKVSGEDVAENTGILTVSEEDPIIKVELSEDFYDESTNLNSDEINDSE